jgi:tol-pal system protein YbgF
MRIRTHGVATAAALALMSACASAPVQSTAPTTSNAELSALRSQQVDQTRRIAELETRLSLLEADARRARDDSGTSVRSSEAVRIGSVATELPSHAATSPPAAVPDSEEDLDGGKRPTLRLYGQSSGSVSPGVGQRVSLPPVPEVSERLPVVPLPEQRAAKALRATGASSSSEGATEQYRKGLRSLQEQRYDEALAQFATFVAEHPQHELVASALYWRGEALYAKRDYSAASKEFEALLERYPSSQRAPDALLKLGLSFRKLGAPAQADRTFQRLRTDFPNSQAAVAAAREGST